MIEKRFGNLSSLVLAASLLACSETPTSTTASAAPDRTLPALSASAAASTVTASSMTIAELCGAVHARVEAIAGKCVARPETSDLLTILKMNLDDDGCSTSIQNVEILADRVPACLAEVRTSWDSHIAGLQSEAACRSAFVGKTAIGGQCRLDLECPPGSYCDADTKSDDPLAMVCSPVITVGTPCKEGSGSSCGPDFYCAAGKCAQRPTVGGPCSPGTQHCARGLTCLLDKSTDKNGKCGPRRKAGAACHRWTECEGACVSPNKATQDGTCESFCGSD